MEVNFLNSLNDAQLRAVKYWPETPLQILAGPGSGKTKVLTSRIAHLILNHHLPPFSICAVTFTNKAANEMRERLTKLIGKERTSQLRMGTFHALCARFLRKYAHLVKLAENFTVCDAEESKKIIQALLKPYTAYLASENLDLQPGRVVSSISKAKSKEQSGSVFLEEVIKAERRIRQRNGLPLGDDVEEKKTIDRIIGEIFVEYEKTLKRNNALDFDDLLTYGVKLFTKNDETVIWCRHILVDEFQDTNITQYKLMRALAIARCVTIVGDPDQSIYGWRSAEVGNLSKMRRDFPDTEQVLLEENYRSTAAILKASLAIISQDKSRIQKSLHTSHPNGFTPVLYQVQTEHEEAAFIAIEMKRLVAHMGGALNWGDFVILLRFNALSRVIETALQKEGIPSRVLGGHKFFERLEVKDLLAYLQVVDNPNFVPAFKRAVNVPGRGIGEKTVAELIGRAEKSNQSPLAIVEAICDNKAPDIKPAVKRKVAPFVTAIRSLRAQAHNSSSPADLVRKLVDLIKYEDHLKKTQSDWESRWENVKELITFASEMEAQNQAEEAADAVAGGDNSIEMSTTPLRQFLQASMLSSEGDNQSEEGNKDKVTISTCHSAKGLEWPVVMIPSVDQNTFPFYRSEDTAEERRLLYVACTRAQSLLYVSRATTRMVAGETKSKELSEFISSVLNDNGLKNEMAFFSQQIPFFTQEDRATIATVLQRPPPEEAEVQRRVATFERSGREHPMQIYWGGGHHVAPSRPKNAYSIGNASYVWSAGGGGITNVPQPGFIRPAIPTPPATSKSGYVSLSSSSGGENRILGTSSAPFIRLQDPSSRPTNRAREVQVASSSKTTMSAMPLCMPSSDDNLGNWNASSSLARDATQPPCFPSSLDHNFYDSSPMRPSSFHSASRQPRRAPQAIEIMGSNKPALPHTLSRREPKIPQVAPASPKIFDEDQPPTLRTPLVVSTPMTQSLQPTALALQKTGVKQPQIAPIFDENQPPDTIATPMPISRPAQPIVPSALPKTGVKRRLGMGRITSGYSNKKFKPPA